MQPNLDEEDIFEEMISAVVDGGLSESAVVDHYYLIHYPYAQEDPEQTGVLARSALDTIFDD